MKRTFGFWAVAGLFLVSCQSALDETRAAVMTTAGAINTEFTAVRTAEQALVAEIDALYVGRADLDLSTAGMDAADGGLYETYPGYKYYYKTKPQGSGLYLSPGAPVTEELKQRVRFLESVDPLLQKAFRTTDVLTTAFYGTASPVAMALLAPWLDVVSTLPPGIDLRAFEWYTRGLDGRGVPVWSERPFTDLTSGWVVDVSALIPSSGSDAGVTVISVNLAKLAAKHIGNQPRALALVGSDGTLVGMTPQAEQLLGVKALEAVDYLKQVKENTFAPDHYKLTDPGQSGELQALGSRLLAGDSEFAVTLGGEQVTVVAAPVPETKMLVVGFSRP